MKTQIHYSGNSSSSLFCHCTVLGPRTMLIVAGPGAGSFASHYALGESRECESITVNNLVPRQYDWSISTTVLFISSMISMSSLPVARSALTAGRLVAIGVEVWYGIKQFLRLFLELSLLGQESKRKWIFVLQLPSMFKFGVRYNKFENRCYHSSDNHGIHYFWLACRFL